MLNSFVGHNGCSALGHNYSNLCRCGRLGLVSLAYLWRRDQRELLKEMIDAQVEAVVIKVAAMGELMNAMATLVEEP